MLSTHVSGMANLRKTDRRLVQLLEPPPDLSIEGWAHLHRVLPTQSGRPGQWAADPYQLEIEEACSDPDVREVVFMKATRLGWSEICNNALGWGIDIHAMAMLMLQPSRDTAEQYAKDRLDQMIESTPALDSKLRLATSKAAGSTTRFKRFTNGASFFVASAGNPRELRSLRARFVIEDEADGYVNDVSNEGDPDKIVRRRMDEYHDSKLLIGSTPGMPSGISRIEKAYNRSSMGIYRVPCPHCNAMEALQWRDPDSPQRYLLQFEKTADNQVIPESVRYVCIRCGGPIEEDKWKWKMLQAGQWEHRRPAVTAVRGFWLNGLNAVFSGHWAKLAQEWVDAQGDQLELKAFINLHLAETFSEPGESVEPSVLRRRAEADVRDRAVVPDGVALLLVEVDVQTAAEGRLEAQVIGFTPDERAFLIDFQVFPGDPQMEAVWEDLDAWLLAGWRHQNGAQMRPHLVLVDARDGNTKDAVYRFCQSRADRWVFPQMGAHTLASKGWAEESGNRKGTVRLFLTSTDDTKRVVFSRLALPLNAPKAIHLPNWVSEHYLEQLAGEKRVPVTNVKTRKTTWQWVKTGSSRNEALDLWSYAYSGWWIITRILAPHLGGPDGRTHLEELARQASASREEVEYSSGGGRRIRSRGYGG